MNIKSIYKNEENELTLVEILFDIILINFERNSILSKKRINRNIKLVLLLFYPLKKLLFYTYHLRLDI